MGLLTVVNTYRISTGRRPASPLRVPALLAVMLIVAAACGDSNGAADGGGSLGGTGWSLETLNGQPIIPGSDPVLDFEDLSQFTGNTACNAFSGSYTTDGSSISMEIGPMTLALCGDDALQQQEGAYIAAIGAAVEYSVTDAALTLSDSAGDEIAGFTALANTLAGTAWTVTAYNNGNQAVVSVITGTEPTANFGTADEVAGFAGCNEYAAAYTTDGGSITLAPLGGTDNTCAADVANQESLLLNAMINSATFSFVGPNRLQLRSADGELQVDLRRATGG